MKQETKSIKVEFTVSKTYVVDVSGTDRDDMESQATDMFTDILSNGTEHYYEQGDERIDITQIYDVTGTEDDQLTN